MRGLTGGSARVREAQGNKERFLQRWVASVTRSQLGVSTGEGQGWGPRTQPGRRDPRGHAGRRGGAGEPWAVRVQRWAIPVVEGGGLETLQASLRY